MSNDRVVGQRCPALKVPMGGTVSLPCWMSWNAAWKKAIALRNDTSPNGEPGRPETAFAAASVSGVAPTSVSTAPLKPTLIVTTASCGSLGTTGGVAGLGPLVVTRG